MIKYDDLGVIMMKSKEYRIIEILPDLKYMYNKKIINEKKNIEEYIIKKYKKI